MICKILHTQNFVFVIGHSELFVFVIGPWMSATSIEGGCPHCSHSEPVAPPPDHSARDDPGAPPPDHCAGDDLVQCTASGSIRERRREDRLRTAPIFNRRGTASGSHCARDAAPPRPIGPARSSTATCRTMAWQRAGLLAMTEASISIRTRTGIRKRKITTICQGRCRGICTRQKYKLCTKSK